MGRLWILFFHIITTIIHGNNGCSISGVSNWLIPLSRNIQDTHDGVIFNATTSDILKGLNRGPYVSVGLLDSELVISTNADYINFEENETIQSIGFSINFGCTDGSTRLLVFTIGIIDTNNNDPVFIPTNNYEYTLPFPIPPNFSITNCNNDLIVRDIDLTTERIDFTLEGSTFFEISYDPSGSTAPKEFKATLRTTTFIRSITEPIILTVTATDVDRTGDPARTATATVTILADSEFTLPEELIFSQPFYIAKYTTEHEIILTDYISLNQGFDSQVEFSLDGQFSEYFTLIQNENQITLTVVTELDLETFEQKDIYLIVRAERNFTSGATATIILQLPEARELKFEKPSYSGTLEINIVTIEEIFLNVGFDNDISFHLTGRYAEIFNLRVNNRNRVEIEIKEEISENIVMENNFLVLTLIASGPQAVTAKTSIFFEIIKDDYVTPVFSQNIYNGMYVSESEVIFPNIALTQGYDETVTYKLMGEHASYFTLNTNSNNVILTLNSTISEDLIFNEKVLLLSILAEKPRTVGANAAVALKFSTELIEFTILKFTKSTYIGQLNHGELTVEDVILESGYSSQIQFTLNGDYKESFTISNINNVVNIALSSIASIEDLTTNSFVVLEIEATRERAVPVTTSVIIDIPEIKILNPIFSKPFYNGSYTKENGLVFMEEITLQKGYDSSVMFSLEGEHSQWFSIEQNENLVTLVSNQVSPLPQDILENNSNLIFAVVANKPETIGGQAAILIDLPKETTYLQFEKNSYTGRIENGYLQLEEIRLSGGSISSIELILVGDFSSYFNITKEYHSIIIQLLDIPEEIITNNNVIILTLEASQSNSIKGHTTIVLEVVRSQIIPPVFEQLYYFGEYSNQEGLSFLDRIQLIGGFDGTVSFELEGDSSQWFNLVEIEENNFTLSLKNENLLEVTDRNVLIFTVAAHKTDTESARATIIISLKGSTIKENVFFDKILYNGKLQDNNVIHETITVANFNDLKILIEGEYSSLFEAHLVNGVVTVQTIGSAVIPSDLTHVTLTLHADNASAVLILDVVDTGRKPTLRFEQTSYIGSFNNEIVTLSPITLSEGYSEDVSFTLHGALAPYFQLIRNEAIITLEVNEIIPEEILVANKIILLGLKASASNSKSAIAVIVLDVKEKETPISDELIFDRTYYTGHYSNGQLQFNQIISLVNGYDSTTIFSLEGAFAEWFDLRQTDNSAILVLSESIPSPVLAANQIIVLEVHAETSAGGTGRTVVIVTHDYETDEAFDKVLYVGKFENGVVSHETITISGYSGTSVQIAGAYQSSFEASIQNGVVTIRLSPSATPLPANLAHIPLTLQAGRADAVLLLEVVGSGVTNPPDVIFSKSSYFFWADVNQTGVVGRVEATASNNEVFEYSLQFNDDYLQDRITINNEGEIILSASIQSGVHSFIVTATTQNSQATASVLLRVEALPKCNSDEGLPPLIILERDEEQPHKNLVVFDQIKENCRYELSNSWPANQSWLYIDNEGLHAEAIDREDQSIAFMTLSQIQVELILFCDSDETSVAKRSLNTERLELGSYNYGSNKWILADTIEYNPRRSFVNLIVNDINDNPPIFIGKENEPIYAGFPVPELQDMILPRALVEVKATDADIGENAALIYWSREDSIAVAPQTGFVHVRSDARLEDNSRLTVYATDLNGRGLNGTLDIVVKFLDINQIAVVTVRNAFLDDESSVLNNLSTSVGYEIKVLRTVVISESSEVNFSRKRRDLSSNPDISLQLYVYGINENEPVNVVQLTGDINNSNVVSVNIARVLSLEDHLEGLEICPIPGRDVGLLVATIVLAVLLFIVILTIILWFVLIRKYKLHLKWRKSQSYKEFDDNNSEVSRNNTIDPIPKVEISPKPRPDIEELKRSERRLQERLDIPIVSIGPEIDVNDIKDEPPTETIVDIVTPIPQLPIVIQSIDKLKDNSDESDEDEFGEKKVKQRKSVVTFNENVEKIIHLEDNFEDPDTPEPTLEIYKF
ncbi:unnamed protein product [Euphydryas editha]|uniref:Uncharacterized protein n=1 Tax=Euphydryas editha TaxID=104508 RepID=A0AAU9VC09_EUPED|nr:unnamed protein product [Euphydryas editha]